MSPPQERGSWLGRKSDIAPIPTGHRILIHLKSILPTTTTNPSLEVIRLRQPPTILLRPSTQLPTMALNTTRRCIWRMGQIVPMTKRGVCLDYSAVRVKLMEATVIFAVLMIA